MRAPTQSFSPGSIASSAILDPIGLGLRAPHYSYILQNKPRIGWFEAISENYMGIENLQNGKPLEYLKKIRELYPIVLHGVSLSIGSTDELNFDYLKNLKRLIETIEPAWVSDHLCWTGVQGENLHDLLPLPYTAEAIDHVCERVDQVQNFLQRQLTLENVSAYLSFRHSEMTECEFLSEIIKRTGCGLLLDVNNVYVSSQNQNLQALDFIRGVPASAVKQIHLAGHSRAADGGLIDTHDGPVSDPVWDLYRQTVDHLGIKPTMVEWDEHIPEFQVLEAEVRRAEKILCEKSELKTERAYEQSELA